MFKLHSRLQQDTFHLGQFSLSEVLLMNDVRYPWVILVPKRNDITEIYQLDNKDQQQLMIESSFVASQLADMVKADKMNVAMLGNVVSQLHLHHVARFRADETWPEPVWGKGQAVPYNKDESNAVCQQLQNAFSALFHNDN